MDKTTSRIIVATLFTALIVPSVVLAQSGLDNLKGEFIAAKNQAVLTESNNYLKRLISLRNQTAAAGNSGELTSVTAEIERMRGEIGALGGVAVIPPVHSATRSVNHTAKTYIKEIKGWAGIPEFSRNNIYDFNIPETGTKSTLTVYASGRNSRNTFGEIFIVTPSGRKKMVHRWEPDDFEIPLKEARNYRDLKPLQVDISEFVKEAGTYQVDFEYLKGDDPLGILRVEIKS